MARGAPALMIGVGEAEPMEGEADPATEAGPGVLAATAFRKALERGDDAAAYEAFKEMLAAADEELSADAPLEEPMPA
jgi:hypothetical protein